MKELAMDIIKMNKRGILARAELEKMMGCKLEDMTDNQKTLGLAMLVSLKASGTNKGGANGFIFKNSGLDRLFQNIKVEQKDKCFPPYMDNALLNIQQLLEIDQYNPCLFDYVEIGNCEKCKWKGRHQNALAVAEIDISKTVMKQNGIRASNNRQHTVQNRKD